RTRAGLFDVSHMGRFEVRGTDAGDFLQGVVTNDLSRVKPGRAQYNLLCRPDGGIVDDLVVYRPTPDGWSIVVNAANREKDWAWLRDRAPAGVELVDRSDELSLLAVQGPGVEGLLPVEDVELGEVPYFGVTTGTLAGTRMVLSRTGYTGEDGFELFVPSDRREGPARRGRDRRGHQRHLLVLAAEGDRHGDPRGGRRDRRQPGGGRGPERRGAGRHRRAALLPGIGPAGRTCTAVRRTCVPDR